MVFILKKAVQKAEREQSGIPGEAGFERIVEGEHSLSRGEIIEKPQRLTEEQIAKQVARIEAGGEPTVPRKILEQAVEEAKRSDKLPPAEVLEAALRFLQKNEKEGEAGLTVDNPAAVSEFMDHLRAATGVSEEKN